MATSDKLGLGLDDIIRLDRGTDRRGGGRGGNRGRGARGAGNQFRTRGGGGIPRASNMQGAARSKPEFYTNNNNFNQFRGAQRSVGMNSTTKLLISNLDHGVTTNDIQELFEDVGAVRSAHVHYDENGRSLGTAEVVYERRVDAIAAQQKYNTLNLDARPMEIRLVSNVDGGVQPNRFPASNGGGGRTQRGGFRNNNANYQRPQNQQNGARTTRPRGGKQQQNGKKEEVTSEDLDADLDAYRSESKQKK